MHKNLDELQHAMRDRQQMQATTNLPKKPCSRLSSRDGQAENESEVALHSSGNGQAENELAVVLHEAERALVLLRVEQAQEILHDAEGRFAKIINEAVQGRDYASAQMLAGLAARIKRISTEASLERARIQQREYCHSRLNV